MERTSTQDAVEHGPSPKEGTSSTDMFIAELPSLEYYAEVAKSKAIQTCGPAPSDKAEEKRYAAKLSLVQTTNLINFALRGFVSLEATAEWMLEKLRSEKASRMETQEGNGNFVIEQNELFSLLADGAETRRKLASYQQRYGELPVQNSSGTFPSNDRRASDPQIDGENPFPLLPPSIYTGEHAPITGDVPIFGDMSD